MRRVRSIGWGTLGILVVVGACKSTDEPKATGATSDPCSLNDGCPAGGGAGAPIGLSGTGGVREMMSTGGMPGGSRGSVSGGAPALVGSGGVVSGGAPALGGSGGVATGGAPALGGSAGTGGMAGGASAIGTLGQPCTTGAYSCAGHAQRQQLACVGDVWAANGTCASEHYCNTEPGVNAGACDPVVAECVGKQTGEVVCRGLNREACGVDRVTTTVAQVCAEACVGGLCQVSLAVVRAGTGIGTLTSDVGGIDCGPKCSAMFDQGTSVTLTANAWPGSYFNGWSGGGCSGEGTCTVTLAAATTVTAEFTQKQTISAGGGHSCGVKADRAVACWGGNYAGQATAPAGSFRQVSAGMGRTCGVKTDATAVCWGYEEYGEATPPAGTF
ncbi:MAG: RCC1 domain-containing protein [Polyangiaceae bacterium]|nr:RCC1 domain-containing protein [Polyangiaceae bacterium]